jgi:hypothetical protein
MAPKRSRKPHRFARRWGEKEEALALKALFLPPGLDAEDLPVWQDVVASLRNERGATELLPTNTPEEGMYPVLHMLIFSVFLLAGVVPPISPFLHTVLTTYGLNLAHLYPSAVVILAVLMCLCKYFISILPSLALFRH